MVIGDIHGCPKSLHALITQLDLQAKDQLFLLGDYVNKGSGSRETLDCILSLRNIYHIYPILGNHDLILLNYLKHKSASARDQLESYNNYDFFNLSEYEEKPYRAFLEKLPFYLDLDHFLLVHAGFDFSLSDPFLDKESMVLIRHFKYDHVKAYDKTIIHGHYPHELTFIEDQIKTNSKILPLDNGCVYTNRNNQGNLLCLNIDNKELWVQPCVD